MHMGRPRLYDGKMNCRQPELGRFQLCHEDDDVIVYSAVVYSPSLQRKVRIAYLINKKHKTYAILFTTDLELEGYLIYRYYKARFQIEFLFRDAKQYTGLLHCQARSANKLYFHFNASLTCVSLAKAMFLESRPDATSFSMNDFKTYHFNKYFLDRFIAKSGIDLSCPKISLAYAESVNLGRMAA